MFCTPPTPFDLLPHKPEDPFGLSQTLKKRSKGNAEFLLSCRLQRDFPECKHKGGKYGCLEERKSNFPKDIVSVVYRVLLLHLQHSIVNINIAVLLCQKYMMSQTDVSMVHLAVLVPLQKYIKIVEIEEMRHYFHFKQLQKQLSLIF